MLRSLLIVVLPTLCWAQPDSLLNGSPSRPISFSVEIGGAVATGPNTPFWLRANRFGTVPLTSPFGFVRVKSAGTLGHKPERKLHIDYGLEVVGNLTPGTTYQPARQVLLSEGYGRLRLGRFELVGGRRKQIIGLVDTLLTSGSYSNAGNAIPIPQVRLGTIGFVPVPLTKNVLAFYTFYSHGWFGNGDSVRGSYLHQKVFFLRIGKPAWPVRVYGGLVHNVQWGGQATRPRSGIVASGKLPSTLKDYWYVVTAQQPDAIQTPDYTEVDGLNRFGNHLGSWDGALEVEGSRSLWMVYQQHPFEDKSGVLWINSPDALYGLSWRSKTDGLRLGRSVRISRVTVEYLDTRQESDRAWIRNLPYDGNDDYFNNGQYADGWTYRYRNIGSPFLTPRTETTVVRYGPDNTYQKAIVNNRVQVFHVGILSTLFEHITVRGLLSFSKNYGRYGVIEQPGRGIWQTSALLELAKPVPWLGGTTLNLALAADKGVLLADGLGGYVSLRKSW